MASSPTETLTILGELETIYMDGLEAVLSDDMDRVQPLLDRADTLISLLPTPARAGEEQADEEQAAAREAVRNAWSRMCGAVKAAAEHTRGELASTRRHRRVTRAYGSERRVDSTRYRADA